MPASSTPKSFALGLDFGTTNTVVATSSSASVARVLPFTLDADFGSTAHSTFRSAMCFWEEDSDASRGLRFEAGPWAIERFIDDPLDCRFLQSFKTFAASKSFTETHIHGKKAAPSAHLSCGAGTSFSHGRYSSSFSVLSCSPFSSLSLLGCIVPAD